MIYESSSRQGDLGMIVTAMELAGTDGGHPEFTRGMVELIVDSSHRFTHEDRDALIDLIERGAGR